MYIMNKQIKNLMSKSLSMLPDKPYCQLTFLLKNKRYPNLDSPVYFNDKLLALKLKVRNPEYKRLVDKYAVREYIKSAIGEEYLIPLIGVYNDPDEVNFKSLPNKFVLKLTSGSQNNLVCTDKSKIDWVVESKNIRKWMKIDPYKRTREWQYKDLPNQFVIEEYIADKEGNTNDYKFWCFNGSPEMVQVDSKRFINHKRNFFDVETFKELDIKVTYEKANNIAKPKNYDDMVKIAKKLSSNLPFSRIDLYNIDGRIYFGEITFYPGNCNERIEPLEYEKILGEKITLEK